MAIAFVQSKSANGNSNAPSAIFTSAPTTNNLLVAWVCSHATSASITISGWTAMTQIQTGAGQSTRTFRGLYKIAGAGESSTVTAVAGTNPWAICIAEYSGIDTTTPLLVENAQANASGTTTTPSVTPTASLAALVSFSISVRAVSGETFSAEQVNSSSTGVTQREAQAAGAEDLADLFVSSTSGSYSGSVTVNTAFVGAGGIAIFQATAAASGLLPPDRTYLQAVNTAAVY